MAETVRKYTEISKAKVQLYAQLESRKFRLKHRMFVAQGHKSVIDTLDTFEPVGICATRHWLDTYASSLGIDDRNILEADERQLQRMSSLKTAPEVIAVYHLPENDANIPKLEKDKLYLLLDGIQDPGNLGSILRTADWFGIDEVFASPDTVDIFNPKAIMATMGSIARVKIRYLNLKALIIENPEMPVYGTLLDGTDIYSSRLTDGGMIIFGNEGKGISPAVRNLIDRPLLIPPFNPERHAESLNVGAATSVVLAEFRRNASLHRK